MTDPTIQDFADKIQQAARDGDNDRVFELLEALIAYRNNGLYWRDES